MSIPSLHLANRLGNSTASLTDWSLTDGSMTDGSLTDLEYCWEDEDEVRCIFGSENEDKRFVRYSDGFGSTSKISKLLLPEDNNRQKDEDFSSNAAVGNVSTDNFLRTNESISFDGGLSEEKEEKKVIVEIIENLGRKGSKTARRNIRRKRGEALEWIHNLQNGSENQVGEAASSKFLTKGISPEALRNNRVFQ